MLKNLTKEALAQLRSTWDLLARAVRVGRLGPGTEFCYLPYKPPPTKTGRLPRLQRP